MRERDINRKLFHRAHYEIIAKLLRESLDVYLPVQEGQPQLNLHRSGALVDFAIDLAKRFQLDNESFDPIIFLDRCSPNPDLYPLSELWEGVNQAEAIDG